MQEIALAGWTNSRDLPIVDGYLGRPQRVYGGGESDGFLLGISASNVSFSTYVGGTGRDRLNAVSALDKQSQYSGYAFAGETDSLGWGLSNVFLKGRGQSDALLGIFGGGALRVMTFGGSGDDRATGVAALAGGILAAAGETSSADFPLMNPVANERKGASDAFLTLVRFDGSNQPELAASTLWGGGGAERVAGLESILGIGLYLAGSTDSSDFPVVNASQPVSGGGTDRPRIHRHASMLDLATVDEMFYGGCFQVRVQIQ